MRSSDDQVNPDTEGEYRSRFSLASRLKIEVPPESTQATLDTLFEPQTQKNGSQTRPKRVLIWGRAGMGKTMLCKKIVYELYKKGLWKSLYDRVVWLPLRRLKRTVSRNIVELLEHEEFPSSGLGSRITEAWNDVVNDDRTRTRLLNHEPPDLELETVGFYP